MRRPSSLFLMPIVLLVLGCVQPGLEGRLRALEVEADRQAVTRLMYAYAHGIDGMDEELLRATFAEDAVAHYVGANFPLDEQLVGIEEILSWLRANVGGRANAVPWHYMSTSLVDVEGDRATLRTFQHNRTMAGVGLYTIEAQRAGGVWRIAQLHLEERILEPTLLESLQAP